MKRKGFTLAEVLIALGVIGVVAAMTIPALMTSYREKEWEAKLKKSFAIATTACERMLVEENVAHVNETQIYAHGTQNGGGILPADITRYFKVLRTPNAGVFYLPDGVQMTIANEGNGFSFVVDLNGPIADGAGGRPDTAGADQFAFDLDENCTYVTVANPGANAKGAFQGMVNRDWKYEH